MAWFERIEIPRVPTKATTSSGRRVRIGRLDRRVCQRLSRETSDRIERTLESGDAQKRTLMERGPEGEPISDRAE